MIDTPPLLLYRRPGCHLCDEARAVVEALLGERRAAGRPVATVKEVDIEGDLDLEARYGSVLPVLELGREHLELATSAGAIRRFLDRALDGRSTPGRAP